MSDRGMILIVEGAHIGRRRSRAGASPASAVALWTGLSRVLAPDAPVDVVTLPTGTAPAAVRAHLTRATVTAGPVIVYLCGSLARDRRGVLHLATRPTTPARIGDDGMPWTWLTETLRPRRRREETTLVIAETSAEPDLARALAADPAPLGVAGYPLWSVILPDTADVDPATLPWTTTLTLALRRGLPHGRDRLGIADVHHDVATRARLPADTVSVLPAADDRIRLANTHPLTTVSPAVEDVVTQEAPDHLGPGGILLATRPGMPAAMVTAAATTPPGHTPRADDPTERVRALRAALAAGAPAEALPHAAALVHALTGEPTADPDAVHDAIEAYAWVLHQVGRHDQAADAYADLAARHTAAHGPTDPRAVAADRAAHALRGRPPAPDTPAPDPRDAAVERINHAITAGDTTAALDLAETLIADLTHRHHRDHDDVTHARDLHTWLLTRADRRYDAVLAYVDLAADLADTHGLHHPRPRAAADNALAVWHSLPDADLLRLGPVMIALREDIGRDDTPSLAAVHTHITRRTPTPPPAPPRS